MKSRPKTIDPAAVAATRRRYYEALASGMRPEAAAAHANGREAPAPVSEAAAPSPAPKVEAPQGVAYADMAWPTLRALAMDRLGPEAKSMKRAEIEAGLTERDGNA